MMRAWSSRPTPAPACSMPTAGSSPTAARCAAPAGWCRSTSCRRREDASPLATFAHRALRLAGGAAARPAPLPRLSRGGRAERRRLPGGAARARRRHRLGGAQRARGRQPADAERGGAGAALSPGAGRGAALHRQRRDRPGGARRALRDPQGLPHRARRHRAAVALSRRHHRAGRSAAWPPPPSACAAAMAGRC